MFITTSLSQAKAFLSMMNNGMNSVSSSAFSDICLGHEDYGCFISKDKTLTNFDYDEQLNSIPHERGMNFIRILRDLTKISP
jgi:telomerase reverse transcriptase